MHRSINPHLFLSTVSFLSINSYYPRLFFQLHLAINPHLFFKLHISINPVLFWPLHLSIHAYLFVYPYFSINPHLYFSNAFLHQSYSMFFNCLSRLNPHTFFDCIWPFLFNYIFLLHLIPNQHLFFQLSLFIICNCITPSIHSYPINCISASTPIYFFNCGIYSQLLSKTSPNQSTFIFSTVSLVSTFLTTFHIYFLNCISTSIHCYYFNCTSPLIHNCLFYLHVSLH